MARFLAWFDREAPGGTLTEIRAVEALESFRRDSGLLKDVSFPSISGAGPNGAIVHYRVTSKSNRPINPGDLFLIDSGGQYEDGTTDEILTERLLAVGDDDPSAEAAEPEVSNLTGAGLSSQGLGALGAGAFPLFFFERGRAGPDGLAGSWLFLRSPWSLDQTRSESSRFTAGSPCPR